MLKRLLLLKFLFSLLALGGVFLTTGQPISGVWRGKISSGKGMFAYSCKVELKLVKRGDSLYGTAYYYANTNSYMRYSVRGHFNQADNAVHWWDEKLLDYKPVGSTRVGVYTDAMISDADFNCPGNNVMKLDGKSRIGEEGPEFVLHFDKTEKPYFNDEWDNVIEGYFTGMADPEIIDSVYAISKPLKPDVPGEAIAVLEEQDTPGKTKSSTSQTNATPDQQAQTPSTLAKNSQPSAGSLQSPALESKEARGTVVKTGENASNPPPVIATGTPVTGIPATDSGRLTRTTDPADKPGAAIPGQPVATGPAAKTGSASTVPASEAPVAKSQEPPPAVQREKIPSNTTARPSTGIPAGDSARSTSQGPVTKTGTSSATTQPVTKTAQPAGPAVARTGTPQTATIAKTNVPEAKKTQAKNDEQLEIEKKRPATTPEGLAASERPPVGVQPLKVPEKIDPVALQKFETRTKVTQAEIPMRGDSIELNFYDNAEVDGDSISLFLNGKLLFNHVLLSAQAYTFKIDTRDLPTGSELTMVAENLGSIPPNTAFMMAVVDGQRYSARLESTEQSSGVIKLVRR